MKLTPEDEKQGWADISLYDRSPIGAVCLMISGLPIDPGTTTTAAAPGPAPTSCLLRVFSDRSEQRSVLPSRLALDAEAPRHLRKRLD